MRNFLNVMNGGKDGRENENYEASYTADESISNKFTNDESTFSPLLFREKKPIHTPDWSKVKDLSQINARQNPAIIRGEQYEV